MRSVNHDHHILCGLAANAALPSELVDRLIAVADVDIGSQLAGRVDLSSTQAAALVSRVEETSLRLVSEGKLTAADIDPLAQPYAALALIDEGRGSPAWARMFAADPTVDRREKLASCAGLPPDVVDALAADSDVRVVAELALWTTPEVAGRLARHPHADVRRAVAANQATPPAMAGQLLHHAADGAVVAFAIAGRAVVGGGGCEGALDLAPRPQSWRVSGCQMASRPRPARTVPSMRCKNSSIS